MTKSPPTATATVTTEDDTVTALGTVGILGGIIVGLIGLGMLGLDLLNQQKSSPIGGAVGLFGLGVMFFGFYYEMTADQRRAQAKINKVEDRLINNPTAPLAAWDLARVKLESYLDRNLRQVSSIYRLVVVTMLAGFLVLIAGVWKGFASVKEAEVMASYVAAAAGLLVQFLGATFLFVFRSTMTQAKAYVQVLERINAVGMSIQILEGIEGEDMASRNAARAGLAKDLLRMYGVSGPDEAK